MSSFPLLDRSTARGAAEGAALAAVPATTPSAPSAGLVVGQAGGFVLRLGTRTAAGIPLSLGSVALKSGSDARPGGGGGGGEAEGNEPDDGGLESGAARTDRALDGLEGSGGGEE